MNWIALILVLFVSYSECAFEMKFYHYLDNTGVRSERASVLVHSTNTNDVKLSQIPLNPTDILKLKNLAAKNDFYRMDIVVRQTNKNDYTLSTFAKACAVVESRLRDNFNVYTDHANNVVGISLAPTEEICIGENVPNSELQSFQSNLYFYSPETGPVPDTLSYIQKLERDKEARERGSTKDNRSFLAKYWMYLVPLVIFMAVSGAANNEQGGAGGAAR